MQSRTFAALVSSTERLIHPIHKGTGRRLKTKALQTNAALPDSQRLLSPRAGQVSRNSATSDFKAGYHGTFYMSPCMYNMLILKILPSLLSLTEIIIFPPKRDNKKGV